MKKTSLKHYRRKKFFYHLLMRSSPRSGGIFGMGLVLSAILLKPLLVWGLIRLHVIGQKFFWLGAVAMLLLEMGLIFTGAMFTAGSQRDWRIGNFITGNFWRRHVHQVLMLAAAILLLVLAGGYWLAQLAVLLLTVLFFVFAPEKRRRKLKKAAFIPVLLCASMIVGVHALVILHEEAIRAKIMLLAKATGLGVRREGLIELEQQGVPVEREPLKTLLTSFRRDDNGGYSDSDSSAEATRKLVEYRKRHPRFISALEKFTMLAPRYIGHRIPSKVGDTELYTEAFRAGTAYCAWLIQTAAGDREAIRAANLRLQNLRDWMLNSQFLYEHLAGNGIENIRIQALAGSLPTAKWSRAEFRELLGEPPHWQGVFLRSRASETLMFEEIITPFIIGIFGDDPKNRVPERLLPDAWRLYFLADWINLLDRQFEAIRVLSVKELDDRPEEQRIKAMEMPNRGYFISELLSPASASEWRSYVRTEDRRRMAELACEVMDFYRRQGKLPADLSFLPDTPGSRLDHHKIEIVTGELPGDEDRSCYGFLLRIADRNRFHTDLVVRLADTPPKP